MRLQKRSLRCAPRDTSCLCPPTRGLWISLEILENIQILAHLVAIDPCTIGTLVPESKLNLTLSKRRHYEEDNNEDVKINTVGGHMLRVKVQYYMTRWGIMFCIESTANITTTTTTTTTSPINITSPNGNDIPLVAGAFAGGNVYIYMPRSSSHYYRNYHTTYYYQRLQEFSSFCCY